MIKATLKTRCGAWKHIDIPYPPQIRISIPLKPKPASFNGLGLGTLFEKRDFELQGFNGNPNGYAEYLEI